MGILLSSAASVVLSSVICNVIGSSILHHTHPEAAYNVLWASRNGAVGGAILTIPWMLVFRLLNVGVERSPSWVQEGVGYAGWVVAAAGSAAAGALGAAVLIASLGEEKVKQGVKESTAAGGVGSGVWLAALIALSLLLGAMMMAFKGIEWIRFKIKEKRGGRLGEGGGGHEMGQVSWRIDGGVAPQPQPSHTGTSTFTAHSGTATAPAINERMKKEDL